MGRQIENLCCVKTQLCFHWAYLVWVITINFWGLCPRTPGVYRLSTNPEEVKRGQVVTLFGLGPCLGARVAPQQSPILRAGREQDTFTHTK